MNVKVVNSKFPQFVTPFTTHEAEITKWSYRSWCANLPLLSSFLITSAFLQSDTCCIFFKWVRRNIIFEDVTTEHIVTCSVARATKMTGPVSVWTLCKREKFVAPTGNRTPTVLPTAWSYTHLAVPAQTQLIHQISCHVPLLCYTQMLEEADL
jgi:hypothetical protein